jgi:hypothetical protein
LAALACKERSGRVKAFIFPERTPSLVPCCQLPKPTAPMPLNLQNPRAACMAPSQRGALTIIRAWFGNAVDALGHVLWVHRRRVGTSLMPRRIHRTVVRWEHKPEKPPKTPPPHSTSILSQYPKGGSDRGSTMYVCMYIYVCTHALTFHGVMNNFWTFPEAPDLRQQQQRGCWRRER